METPAFRPGRKRRFTSPGMSVILDSVFACPGTGYAGHADVNAARNIAAGHAVTARPVNREPHLLASLTGRE